MDIEQSQAVLKVQKASHAKLFALFNLNNREKLRNIFYLIGYFLVFILILYLFLFAKFKFEEDFRRLQKIQNQRIWIADYEASYKTPLGKRSFKELLDEIFFSLDFILIKKDLIPTIVPIKPASCDKIIESKINRATHSYKKISFEQKWIFSMNQYVHLIEDYKPEFFLTQDELSLEIAARKYLLPKQNHLIYGSSTSQIEEIVSNISNPWVATGIDSINKIEKKWKDQFDAIISLGYLETIGFANGGEDLNAELDFHEMQRIHCLLKEKGTLIITVPLGWDSVVWNQRRIYGKIRLPLLLSGFEIVDSFYEGSPFVLTRDLFEEVQENRSKFANVLLVLKKV